MPVSAPVPSSSSSTVAWNVVGAAVAETGREHRDGGAALDLAPVADHAAGAAADQALRGQDLVDRLEHGVGCREDAPGDEHDRELAAPRRRARRTPPRRPRAPPSRASGTVDRPVPMRTPMVLLTILRALLALAPGKRGRRRARAMEWRGRGRTRRRGAILARRVAAARHRRVRAHRRGQDRGRDRARAAPARRGEDPVAVSADAMQVYEGLPILTGAASAQERRSSSTGCSASSRSRRRSPPAPTPNARTRRSTRSSRRAGARSSSAAPASTCAPRSPSSTCARRWTPDPRQLGQRPAGARPTLHAAAARRGARGHRADRPPAHPARPRAARGRP